LASNFTLVQQPNSGLSRLFFEISVSPTIRHARARSRGHFPERLISPLQKRHLHNKRKRQKSLPAVGFESAVVAMKLL